MSADRSITGRCHQYTISLGNGRQAVLKVYSVNDAHWEIIKRRDDTWLSIAFEEIHRLGRLDMTSEKFVCPRDGWMSLEIKPSQINTECFLRFVGSKDPRYSFHMEQGYGLTTNFVTDSNIDIWEGTECIELGFERVCADPTCIHAVKTLVGKEVIERYYGSCASSTLKIYLRGAKNFVKTIPAGTIVARHRMFQLLSEDYFSSDDDEELCV